MEYNHSIYQMLVNYLSVEQEIETAKKKNGRTLELTALGVGAKTIGGKTYVAIGFELTNTTPQN